MTIKFKGEVEYLRWPDYKMVSEQSDIILEIRDSDLSIQNIKWEVIKDKDK